MENKDWTVVGHIKELLGLLEFHTSVGHYEFVCRLLYVVAFSLSNSYSFRPLVRFLKTPGKCRTSCVFWLNAGALITHGGQVQRLLQHSRRKSLLSLDCFFWRCILFTVTQTTTEDMAQPYFTYMKDEELFSYCEFCSEIIEDLLQLQKHCRLHKESKDALNAFLLSTRGYQFATDLYSFLSIGWPIVSENNIRRYE